MTDMQTITEGLLTFTFSEQVSAQKYDDWSFYTKQFTNTFGGAKAVDFVCLEQDCAWLVEVKDYRSNRRTKPSDIGEEIAQKVRDTLAGLVAASCNAKYDHERDFAANALTKDRLRIVLHLEQPPKHSRLFPRVANPANLTKKLKQLLKGVDAHPVVVDQHSLISDMRWTVTG